MTCFTYFAWYIKDFKFQFDTDRTMIMPTLNSFLILIFKLGLLFWCVFIQKFIFTNCRC